MTTVYQLNFNLTELAALAHLLQIGLDKLDDETDDIRSSNQLFRNATTVLLGSVIAQRMLKFQPELPTTESDAAKLMVKHLESIKDEVYELGPNAQRIYEKILDYSLEAL